MAVASSLGEGSETTLPDPKMASTRSANSQHRSGVKEDLWGLVSLEEEPQNGRPFQRTTSSMSGQLNGFL